MEPCRIILHDMPAVEGLCSRSPGGDQDVGAEANAIAAVHTGRAERDAVDPLSTLESIPTAAEIRAALAQAAAVQQLDRWLAAEINSVVVGYR